VVGDFIVGDAAAKEVRASWSSSIIIWSYARVKSERVRDLFLHGDA
jgi:hypothetical protein